MENVKAKIRVIKDQCNEDRCNPRLNVMVQRKAAAQMMAYMECLNIIRAEEELLETKEATLFHNIMHRLYPFRFIAVFVIAAALTYLLIR